jgi:hypothetical protein
MKMVSLRTRLAINACPVAAGAMVAILAALPAKAQHVAQIDFESVGRASPLRIDASEADGTFSGGFLCSLSRRRCKNDPPRRIEPLERDLFTTDDFYIDQEFWSDPRYFRCNSSYAIEAIWTDPFYGGPDPSSPRWGDCDVDYSRDSIVSPYIFPTAEAHYEALLEETSRRGGPTTHTYATLPGEWSGVYAIGDRSWYTMHLNQVPTILSLLTSDYQTRFVQQAYHQGKSNAPQWPAQYCWPEGFMRRWHLEAVRDHHILVTPEAVQILAGVAGNFITNIRVGAEFKADGPVPYLSEQVPRWYGEAIGFWDRDTLITWTSNVQGWTVHSAFEFSSRMQTIEVYTPNRNDEGDLVGLNHEATFYDPEALVEPIRIIRNLVKLGETVDSEPYVFVECLQAIFPIDGIATPVAPGSVIEYPVPDMYGRPWAKIWETEFEQGMRRPREEDIFSFE